MEKLLVQVHQDTSSSVSRVSVLSLYLLLRILDQLPRSGDRKNFRLACRSFARAEASHRRSLKILRREFLIPLLRRYPAVVSLDRSSCPSFGDESLAEACGGSSGVEWKGAGGAGGGVPGAGGGGPVALRGVGGSGGGGGEGAEGSEAGQVPGGDRHGSGEGGGGCARLERLGIRWCMEKSDIGIELLVKKSRDLKLLDLSYLKITNESLRSIASLEKLEVLSKVGCSRIDDDGFRYLNNGSNSLRIVDVSCCYIVTSSGLISVIEGRKHIHKLDIGACTAILLQAWSSEDQALNTLKLGGCLCISFEPPGYQSQLQEPGTDQPWQMPWCE